MTAVRFLYTSQPGKGVYGTRQSGSPVKELAERESEAAAFGVLYSHA